MSPVAARTDEPAEAVIISGPRKGEIITLNAGGEEITPEAEAMVEEMISAANQILVTLREMREEGEQFRVEMEERKRERDELIRALG